MKKRLVFPLALLVGLALLALALGSFWAMPAVAGPLAIPTPIAATADVGPGWIMLTFIQTDTVTGTQTSPGYHLPSYPVADIQWVLGFTDSETVTCKLQFSNDNTSWADGIGVVGSASADVTNIDQFNLFGRYVRATCVPSDTNNAYTVTVIAKIHR